MGDHANHELRDKLNSEKHFFVDSAKLRLEVFNFAVAELNPHMIAVSLRTVLSKLDSACKTLACNLSSAIMTRLITATIMRMKNC